MARRKRKSRRNQMLISYLLSFALMLSLISLSFLVLGKYSMLSVRGVMHSCDRIEYYDDIRKEMYTEACYIAIPFGIEKKCIKKVFNNEQIRKDMQDVLEDQIDGNVFVIDTEHLREKLTANVIEQNGELNEEQQKSLDSYIVEVENCVIDI